MTNENPVVENLLLGVTGSVAVVNITAYLTEFRQRLARHVRVVTTRSAERMMPAESIALYCDEVVSPDSPAARKAAHVGLAQWASLFVVLPASANVMGAAANGLAPSFLTSTLLAAEPGVVFFPNMNTTMWRHPAVSRNVERLRADGHRVVVETRSATEVATGETVDAPVVPPPAEAAAALHGVVEPTGGSDPVARSS
ncbi:flavoprotein [Halostreptopolyspora alba]|uniref:flavoprotein n=1 Tax=Halostreptopolyspora alba TaxID=2487137 RepID=UPI0026A6A533